MNGRIVHGIAQDGSQSGRLEMRTSVQLKGPVVERPVEDVFAFISNLENSPRWGRAVKTVKDPDSPDGVGAVFREEARILGQKVKHQSEVTRSDPPTEFSYASRFQNGVTERTRITFEAVEGGTRVGLAAEVQIDQVPQVLAPLVSLFMEQRMAALLKKFEHAFEPPDRSVMGAAILIAVGAILLATAGMRYLIEVFPESGWWKVLAMFASSLFAGGAAFIVWKATHWWATEQTSEPALAERSPKEEKH